MDAIATSNVTMCPRSVAQHGIFTVDAAAGPKSFVGQAQAQDQGHATATAMPNGILCPVTAGFCIATAGTAASASSASATAIVRRLAFGLDLSSIAKTKEFAERRIAAPPPWIHLKFRLLDGQFLKNIASSGGCRPGDV